MPVKSTCTRSERAPRGVGVADPVVAQALADSTRSAASGRPRRSPDAQPIRILIVGAEPLACLGLTALFARARHCQVSGQASNDGEALDLARASHPDVVLVATSASDDETPPDVRRLAAEQTGAAIIVLGESVNVVAVADAIHLGVRGYLPRHTDADQLVEAVEIVAAGGTHISPSVSGALEEWFRAGQPEADPFERLTGQELRVVELVGQGKTNRAIATHVGLSEYTVKTYVSSALRKLGFKRRAQVAAAIAARSPARQHV